MPLSWSWVPRQSAPHQQCAMGYILAPQAPAAQGEEILVSQPQAISTETKGAGQSRGPGSWHSCLGAGPWEYHDHPPRATGILRHPPPLRLQICAPTPALFPGPCVSVNIVKERRKFRGILGEIWVGHSVHSPRTGGGE